MHDGGPHGDVLKRIAALDFEPHKPIARFGLADRSDVSDETCKHGGDNPSRDLC